MRKPNKPPPPPPLRPKSPLSLLAPQTSETIRGGSEYEGSVSSVPCSFRSLQPRMVSISPSNSHYFPCRSESGCSVGASQSNSTCCRSCLHKCHNHPTTCCESPCCSTNVCRSRHCSNASLCNRWRTHSPCHTFQNHNHHTHNGSHDYICSPPLSFITPKYAIKPLPPTPTNQENLQNFTNGDPQPTSVPEAHARDVADGNYPTCSINGTQSHYTTNTSQNLGTPPVPRERVTRPCISMSPKPVLNNVADDLTLYDGSRSHYFCKPLHYQRHIEKHIEKMYRYFEEREKRREQEYKNNNLLADDDTIETLIAQKETQYLRSLRTPISMVDFEQHKKLGSGYMGQVYLVRKVMSGPRRIDEPEYYAMKKVNKTQVYQLNHMAHIIAERDMLAEADNEWIVKLYYSFQDNHHLYFILEYTPGGDMMSRLQRSHQFDEETARFYIGEISLAVQFVHDKGFIHRDIKPDNILIDRKGHIKLADFGLCTSRRWSHDSRYYKDDTSGGISYELHLRQNSIGNFDEHPTITKALTRREIDHSSRARALSLVGSPNYIAPEVLRQAHSQAENLPSYDQLCDWWSVGVILYEMLMGFAPFIDVEKVLNNTYNVLEDKPEDIQIRILHWRNYLRFPTDKVPQISGNARSLIQGLLQDASERLCKNGIVDIQEHPFFAGFDWKNIRSHEPPFVPEVLDPLDTSNFDNLPNSSLSDNRAHLSSSGLTARMPMNDFTYKRFK